MTRLGLNSLAARLVLVLACVQAAVVLAGMALWMLTSPYVSFDDVAAETASGLVAGSVVRGAAGAELHPTPALARYAARRPGLRYAALEGGRLLEGSSPELAMAIQALAPAMPLEGRLAAAVPGGEMRLSRGAGGLVIATSGDAFHIQDDLGTFFTTYAVELVPMFGPAILAAALAVPLAVGRVLRPLRAARATVERIDFSTLDRRLTEDVPRELRPFMAAINRLLARVEEGAQRHLLFTANAAHELRTPVAILQARLDALPPGALARDALETDLRRITAMLNQLLAVARFGHRDVVRVEEVALQDLARSVVSDLAPLAMRRSRGLALDRLGPDVTVRGDARALESALGNLVINALRAAPEGGTVTVEAGPGPRIAVIDQGPGLSAAEAGLAFEPFWRKDDASEGTGLGLTIVRQVMRLHGGEVRVSSSAGTGTMFELLFPGGPAQPAHPAPPRTSAGRDQAAGVGAT